MNVIGAGWVSETAYGAVRKQLNNGYAGELRQALKAEGVLNERVKNAGKFDSSTNKGFCSAALALRDADFSKDWKNVALIGTGHEESTQANQTYFSDYVDHGRKLARANLFIYTLPTSPLAEIAIHFKLDGPLFYTSDHLLRTTNGFLSDGDASHVLAIWSEKEFTAALLLNTEEGFDLEKFQTLEKPEQLIRSLQDHFKRKHVL